MLLVVAILLAVFVLDEPWTWIAVLAGATYELVETTLIVRWSKRRRATRQLQRTRHSRRATNA